jgi:hypothetical protein
MSWSLQMTILNLICCSHGSIMLNFITKSENLIFKGNSTLRNLWDSSQSTSQLKSKRGETAESETFCTILLVELIAMVISIATRNGP